MKFKLAATALTIKQLVWAAWAIGIFLLIQGSQIIFSLFFNGNEVDYFYHASVVAGSIYMFVIGIMAIYFLPYLVENGITRKDYFKGNIVAALIVSIVLPIISYIISIVIRWGITTFLTFQFKQPDFSTLPETDTNLIGDILQTFLLPPFFDLEKSIILSLAMFSLNLFIFYLIGWLIGSAFYRLNVISGIIVIFIGIAINVVKDSMLRVLLDQPLFLNFSFMKSAPHPFAVFLIVMMIILTIIFIRLLTKRTAIKM